MKTENKLPLLIVVAKRHQLSRRWKYLVSYDGDYYVITNYGEELTEPQMEQMILENDKDVAPAELPVYM